MDNSPIYLDYNATTPVDPRVVEAMLPYFTSDFGNPSSNHPFGRAAHDAIEQARSQVARLIGAKPGEVVFTCGGSEADNLAILGSVIPRLADLPHVVASSIEHPAILNTLAYLRGRFSRSARLPMSPASAASPFTPTGRNRSASFQSMSNRWVWT